VGSRLAVLLTDDRFYLSWIRALVNLLMLSRLRVGGRRVAWLNLQAAGTSSSHGVLRKWSLKNCRKARICHFRWVSELAIEWGSWRFPHNIGGLCRENLGTQFASTPPFGSQTLIAYGCSQLGKLLLISERLRIREKLLVTAGITVL